MMFLHIFLTFCLFFKSSRQAQQSQTPLFPQALPFALLCAPAALVIHILIPPIPPLFSSLPKSRNFTSPFFRFIRTPIFSYQMTGEQEIRDALLDGILVVTVAADELSRRDAGFQKERVQVL